jgi:hypothetical protein
MYEDSMEPEEMLKLYEEGGRPALIERLCTFEGDEINGVMTEIIDCSIGAFKGEIPTARFIEQMSVLNVKLYDTLTDVALDQLNESEFIDTSHITDSLDELQEKKAEMDERVKNI